MQYNYYFCYDDGEKREINLCTACNFFVLYLNEKEIDGVIIEKVFIFICET